MGNKLLPLDFVSANYHPQYVSGFASTTEYLLIWYDAEVQVWSVDDNGLVEIPANVDDDIGNSALKVYVNIDMPDLFSEVLEEYL